MEMETESEEEEDGQISKFEEQEERDRQLYGAQPAVIDETVNCEDLSKCQITRTVLVKHYAAPWFADFCKGTGSNYLPSTAF